MKVKDRLWSDVEDLKKNGPINIVIFGDSVSHGSVNGYYDYENVYWRRLERKLHEVRQYMPINMINSAIGGTSARSSVGRLDSQVFRHEPDLIIVCFGLNDVNGELSDYLNALREIFGQCLERGYETIFMTPNMLNTYVAEDAPAIFLDYAHKTAEMQNGGKMDRFMEGAIALAQELGVPVCDCYSKWKELAKTQDTTLLLANRINHPSPEMHALFADSLFDLIMGDAVRGNPS